ncbi:MAG TPA: hypothetical protein VJ978_08770, partial [Nitriliruptoraceae bacterium]|nr:hypothetical protein [Nitriliruptoraceae bacterium]
MRTRSGEVVPGSYRRGTSRFGRSAWVAVVAEQTPDYLAQPVGSSDHATRATATPATSTPATATPSGARLPGSSVRSGEPDGRGPWRGQSDRSRPGGDGFADAMDRVHDHLLGDREVLGRLGADALRGRLAVLRRLEGATTAAIAATVAALDAAGGIEADGAASKAEWLKANTGRSGREAARLGRLADGLDRLPGTAGALSTGDLTAEAADAIVQATRDGRLGDP